MIYITGDCHREFSRFNTQNFPEQYEMTKEDYVIICGDFGGVWDYGKESKEEKHLLDWLDGKPFTTLFVSGNHENFDRSFDFMDYVGNVDKDDPTILHAEVDHLDKDYSTDLSKFNSKKIEAIEEFYIYTGEKEDPEINPVEVLSLTLEQHLTVTNVDKKLLKSITF